MSDTPKQDFYAQSLVEQLSVDPEAWQCSLSRQHRRRGENHLGSA